MRMHDIDQVTLLYLSQSLHAGAQLVLLVLVPECQRVNSDLSSLVQSSSTAVREGLNHKDNKNNNNNNKYNNNTNK